MTTIVIAPTNSSESPERRPLLERRFADASYEEELDRDSDRTINQSKSPERRPLLERGSDDASYEEEHDRECSFRFYICHDSIRLFIEYNKLRRSY